MVNFFMFASEIPNKSKAFGFAATKRRSPFVTTSGAETPLGAAATITSVSQAIGGLYAEVERADATPTTAQRNATSETERHFSEVTTHWEALKKKDLPGLNQQLRKANLSEIRLESKSVEPGESDDIE